MFFELSKRRYSWPIIVFLTNLHRVLAAVFLIGGAALLVLDSQGLINTSLGNLSIPNFIWPVALVLFISIVLRIIESYLEEVVYYDDKNAIQNDLSIRMKDVLEDPSISLNSADDCNIRFNGKIFARRFRVDRVVIESITSLNHRIYTFDVGVNGEFELDNALEVPRMDKV